MDDLKQSLARLGELGKVLVLLDACHSGSSIAGTKDGLPPDIETVRSELAAAGNGVIVLTSSQGQELSKENPDWQHGAFTKAVLEALMDTADSDGDPWLNVTELEAYVERRVHSPTSNNIRRSASSASTTTRPDCSSPDGSCGRGSGHCGARFYADHRLRPCRRDRRLSRIPPLGDQMSELGSRAVERRQGPCAAARLPARASA